MQGQLIQADHNLRRRVQRASLVVLVTVVAVMFWMRNSAQEIQSLEVQSQFYFQELKFSQAELMQAKAQRRAETLQTVMSGVVLLAGVPLGLWALFTALRIFAARQYPAPRMSVLRDTYVVQGGEAMLSGGARLLAAVVILSGTGYAWWYVYTLGQ